MAAAKFTNRFDGKIDARRVDTPKGICRFMFVELLFRMAKFLYGTYETMTQNEVFVMKVSSESVEHVKVSSAFFMFIKEKVLPFYKKQKIHQNTFRKNLLSHPDIEVVFTMNEQSLRAIYKLKSVQNRDTKYKPHNAEWMILEDCQSLLREDLPIKLKLKIIN